MRIANGELRMENCELKIQKGNDSRSIIRNYEFSILNSSKPFHFTVPIDRTFNPIFQRNLLTIT